MNSGLARVLSSRALLALLARGERRRPAATRPAHPESVAARSGEVQRAIPPLGYAIVTPVEPLILLRINREGGHRDSIVRSDDIAVIDREGPPQWRVSGCIM